jgi:hypothetical protein
MRSLLSVCVIKCTCNFKTDTNNVCVCVCVCIYIYIYIYVSVCVCVCVLHKEFNFFMVGMLDKLDSFDSKWIQNNCTCIKFFKKQYRMDYTVPV